MLLLYLAKSNALPSRYTTTPMQSKQKRNARLTLSSVKCWSDADPDMPQFTTMDEFDIAKSVLSVSKTDKIRQKNRSLPVHSVRVVYSSSGRL